MRNLYFIVYNKSFSKLTLLANAIKMRKNVLKINVIRILLNPNANLMYIDKWMYIEHELIDQRTSKALTQI